MSELRTDTITASDGTSAVTLTKQSAAKAWNTFAGNGTVIRDSFNIASLIDDGSGISSHNFVNNMSNTHFTSSSSASYINNTSNYETYLAMSYVSNLSATRTTGQNNIGFWETAFTDPANDACCSVLGDLA
jgi:hypothetical protein